MRIDRLTRSITLVAAAAPLSAVGVPWPFFNPWSSPNGNEIRAMGGDKVPPESPYFNLVAVAAGGGDEDIHLRPVVVRGEFFFVDPTGSPASALVARQGDGGDAVQIGDPEGGGVIGTGGGSDGSTGGAGGTGDIDGGGDSEGSGGGGTTSGGGGEEYGEGGQYEDPDPCEPTETPTPTPTPESEAAVFTTDGFGGASVLEPPPSAVSSKTKRQQQEEGQDMYISLTTGILMRLPPSSPGPGDDVPAPPNSAFETFQRLGPGDSDDPVGPSGELLSVFDWGSVRPDLTEAGWYGCPAPTSSDGGGDQFGGLRLVKKLTPGMEMAEGCRGPWELGVVNFAV